MAAAALEVVDLPLIRNLQLRPAGDPLLTIPKFDRTKAIERLLGCRILRRGALFEIRWLESLSPPCVSFQAAVPVSLQCRLRALVI